MTKKWIFGLLTALLLAVAGFGTYSYCALYTNAVKQPQSLYISSQSTYTTLLDSLLPKINYRKAFELYADHLNLANSYKAGHYLLEEGMTTMQIARMIKLGAQTPINITFNNTRIPSQLAQKLAPQIDADSASLSEAFLSTSVAQKYGLDSVTLSSIFIPNTYEVYWTITAEEFVARMAKESDRFWNEERKAKLKAMNMTRLEAVTLASIVAEETRKVDEMPRVAGVYINRIKKGIPLQADPTIKFAMQDFALRRILYKHLKYPSPYNTYINKGLPPSPITMPAPYIIDAVLNYEHHDYIYFCARETFDGYHNFARTYSEHKRNARKYQAELNRRKIK